MLRGMGEWRRPTWIAVGAGLMGASLTAVPGVAALILVAHPNVPGWLLWLLVAFPFVGFAVGGFVVVAGFQGRWLPGLYPGRRESLRHMMNEYSRQSTEARPTQDLAKSVQGLNRTASRIATLLEAQQSATPAVRRSPRRTKRDPSPPKPSQGSEGKD